MIELKAEERLGLETLIRRHTTPQQLARRSRIILLAAEGLNNAQIAGQLDVNLNTVRRWRQRWMGLQAANLEDPSAGSGQALSIEERLNDVPRPGAPVRISPEQVCQIVPPGL